MQVTGNYRDFYNETMLPALREVVESGRRQRPAQFPKFFTIESSDRSIEQYSQMSGVGRFQAINQAGKIRYDQPVAGFNKTFKHSRYGLAVPTSLDMVEDDKWGLIRKMHRDLGWSCQETREIDAASTFNNAFDSSYTGPDGKSLCATDHPLYKAGGTQSNSMTAADLDMYSLQVGLTAWEKMKRPSGEFVRWPAARLVVAPENRFTAFALTNSGDDPTTADRSVNPLKGAEDGMPTPTVWTYLTDPDAWFLVASPENTGLIWFDRRKPYTQSWTDNETEVGVVGMRYKKSHGWYDYIGVLGNRGA